MNNILLDTHIFIWLMSGSDRLTQKAKKSIETCTENEGYIFVSAISIWEIGMLAQKGRLTLKDDQRQLEIPVTTIKSSTKK